MKELLRGFWGYFVVIVFAAALALIGALASRSILGWALLSLGVLTALACLILGFIRKQFFQPGYKWQTVALLAITLVLIVLSGVKMFSAGAGSSAGGPGGGMPPQMQAGTPPAAMPTTEAATATAAASATLEPTITATEVVPTATATTVVVSSFTVCLNENTNVGYNIRVAPKDDAAFAGKIPMGGCFVVDGRSSDYPGWYKMAAGQNGSNGISIGVDDSTVQLWVKGYYIEAFNNDLETLPEVTVLAN